MKKVSADQVDRELLSEQSKGLLKELHLLTREGELNADARRKLKQINHFAGFVQPAIDDLQTRHANPVLVDVASGNSYLGFILYELFLQKSGKGELLSVEAKADLAQKSRERAQRLGFARMKFQESAIDQAVLPERVHLLAALHACDTATDDAIVLGLHHKVDYLFLVPCCQAEVAQLLKKVPASACGPLYEDGHHRREFGSHLTNVLRVLVLRSRGYQVTVTELAAWEHTAKNELIIAKRINQFNAEAQQDLNALLRIFPVEPHLLRKLTPHAKAG